MNQKEYEKLEQQERELNLQIKELDLKEKEDESKVIARKLKTLTENYKRMEKVLLNDRDWDYSASLTIYWTLLSGLIAIYIILIAFNGLSTVGMLMYFYAVFILVVMAYVISDLTHKHNIDIYKRLVKAKMIRRPKA